MIDKYEYKLKFEQMKALTAEGDYAAAAEIADTIQWRKVRNMNLLIKAGDIYCKRKRYDEAKEILQMAYDRSPIGRMIIYRLAEIAVKMKNFEEAEEYYDEFVELAPRDNLKYVLRYKISKAKGADIQARIAILEELNEAEYTEEWALELAYLYHKAGENEKCIDACDKLILWFGDGIYVERAMELKMLYQPLTKSQEDKYRVFKQRRDGIKEVYPKRDAVRIPPVQENIGKYNTTNLQEELKKSMQQMKSPAEQEPAPGINGWERTSRAAQTALEIAKQRRTEPQKAKALQEAEDIMDRLVDVIPSLDAEIAPDQRLREQYLSKSGVSTEERAGRYMAGMNNMLQQQIDRFQEENEAEPDLLRKIKRAKPNFEGSVGVRPFIPRNVRPPERAEAYEEQPLPEGYEAFAARESAAGRIPRRFVLGTDGQEEIRFVDTSAEYTRQANTSIEPDGENFRPHGRDPERTGEGVLLPQGTELKETGEGYSGPLETAPEEPDEEYFPPQGIMQQETGVGDFSPQEEIQKEPVTEFAGEQATVPGEPQEQYFGGQEIEPIGSGAEYRRGQEIEPIGSGAEYRRGQEIEPIGSGAEYHYGQGMAEAGSAAEYAGEQYGLSEEGFMEDICRRDDVPEEPAADYDGQDDAPEESAAGYNGWQGEMPEEAAMEYAGQQGYAPGGTADGWNGQEIALPEDETEEFPEMQKNLPPEPDEVLSEEMKMAEAEFYGIPVDALTDGQNDTPLYQPDLSAEELAEGHLARQDTKEIKAKIIAEALDRHAEDIIVEDDEVLAGSIPEQNAASKTQDMPEITAFDDAQKAIFSYFAPVAGMQEQICRTLSHTLARFAQGGSSASGHIVIQGGRGCGKTILAKRLIMALQKEVQRPQLKLGKIDAEKLNEKDLSGMLKKMAGGCLLIERAGDLNRETAVKLSLLVEHDSSGLLIILEDTRVGLEDALRLDEGFAKRFTEKIKIPVFTSDELVEFGRTYAHERDYEIDNMGVLALYNRISNIQRLDQPTTLTEVKDIIDEAIEKAEKKSWKKAFSILTSRRYTENDYIILREKDFEE